MYLSFFIFSLGGVHSLLLHLNLPSYVNSTGAVFFFVKHVNLLNIFSGFLLIFVSALVTTSIKDGDDTLR